jgi:hypothetical protein
VSKLRASDGVVLGTFSVSKVPLTVAYDGANIWVGNDRSSISKLKRQDSILNAPHLVRDLPPASTKRPRNLC